MFYQYVVSRRAPDSENLVLLTANYVLYYVEYSKKIQMEFCCNKLFTVLYFEDLNFSELLHHEKGRLILTG